MKIRKAEPADLTRIVEIEGLCFPQETAFPPSMFAYLIRYSEALVACDKGEVVGFIMGYINGNVGMVYTLDVHPLYRKKGIGSRLLHALEDIIYFQGAKTIRLEAALEKPETMRLYKQAGYKEQEIIENYYGRRKHAVRMLKILHDSA